MVRQWPWSSLLLILAFAACQEAPPPPDPEPDPVEVIQELNEVFETEEDYSPKRFDPQEIEDHLANSGVGPADAGQILDFYARRDHQYAWFINDTLSESADAFLALISSADTIHKAVASLRDDVGRLIGHGRSHQDIAKVELDLTAKFFQFASNRYEGFIHNDLKDLAWYIPRKKKNYDRLLDSLVKGGMDLSAVEPVHPQYFLVKQQLKEIHSLITLPWDSIRLEGKRKIEPGMKDPSIARIRQRLHILGDLPIMPDSLPDSLVYDGSLMEAVRSFQQRHGLLMDGIIGQNVLAALNVPPDQRLRTLLLNMERLRWLPEQDDANGVMVNIPEFKLHVYEDAEIRLSMEVVVGKAATRTVVFSDTITYLVFSPTWTLPKSIIRNEILPALEKDPQYLEKKNMEIIGGTKSDPLIRQRPGGNNSLGRVKFMFPNSYSIYLHDTPARSLFQRQERAFSHGCIRVSEPVSLAEYLLRNDTTWTTEKIKKAMHGGKETIVSLKDPVPVMITYFTAWVDVHGRVNFRDDIYGHDERLARELFSAGGELLLGGKADELAVQE